MLPVGDGQDNPILIFLRDNISHVVFTTKFDAPFQSTSFIESLEQDGSEIGRIAVNSTIRNGIIVINYSLGLGDCNCSESTVVSVSTDKKTFTLNSASSFKESGGDRIELMKLNNGALEYIADARVLSRSGNTIVLEEAFDNVSKIRLKISRGAVILNGTSTAGTGQVIQNGWFKYEKYKDSTMNLNLEEQIFLK